MTIYQIAERLNQKAIAEGFDIAQLPKLRKKHLHKKQLPNRIFTTATIRGGEDKWAFHYGGRDEMQFNIGEEYIGKKTFTRFALCFSLEASRSLTNPVEDLEPFKESFNLCFEEHPQLFEGFEMWYSRDSVRNGNYPPQVISDEWFQEGTFISFGKLIEKPISELNERDLKEILTGFDKLLPIYQKTVLERATTTPKVKIFTRLTSNENNWELPSPHKWKTENQEKQNIPFENQYGFGHEEWLLNTRYNVNGFQYGFIRGLSNKKQNTTKYDEVHLYTVKKEKSQNQVFYLGFIKNVFPIKNNIEEQKIILDTISKFNADMIIEIENINADLKGITQNAFEAVVKFRLEDVCFFDEPVYQPYFNLGKYKRFQPYQILDSIEEVFASEKKANSSGFLSGKADQTSIYNRKSKESSITIEKVHSEIIEALEKFLNPQYCTIKGNLSIERTRFNGNIADVVTQEKDTSITIYEIKTSASGRRNIRDAIGQLLDYALHSVETVKKLLIVSPSYLNKSEIEFLEKLKNSVTYPIEYMSYQKDDLTKFIIQ